MIDFYDSHMTDILPDSIKGDPLVKAMSYAISNAVKRIMQNAGKAGVYAMIDSMDEKALDLLAVELRTKYYGKWLDPEEKKTMIKKTLLWYTRAGTPFTVRELSDFVFQNARVEEWFEYGADAYLFRLIVNVTDRDISLESYMEFLRSVYGVKNTRSHLEAIIFQCDKWVEIKTVAAGGIGSEIKIKARVAKSVEIITEDRPTAAVIFESSVYVEASDLIAGEDVYILTEDGEKKRVLTENGSVVRAEENTQE